MKPKIIRLLPLIGIPVALYLLFTLTTSGFGAHSIVVIIDQTMLPTAMGYGMCACILAGMVDLSIGTRVVLGAIIGGKLVMWLGPPGLVLGCFMGAMAGAAVQALLYRLLRIPAMVLSIGIIMLYEVVAAVIGGVASYVRINNSLAAFGSFPYNTVILLAAAGLFYMIFYRTKTGCQIKVVGSNEKLSQSMGIHTSRVKTAAYIFSALMCGFAAVLAICYSGTISVSTGTGTLSMIFKPIMGVMIGIQLVKFYDNLPLLIFIGELCIQIIFNGFIALGFPDAWQNMMLGIFILAVMAFTGDATPGLGDIRRSVRRRREHAQAG
jgi:ribose transport system permease protein